MAGSANIRCAAMDRAECQYQRHERGTGGYRVCEEGYGDITVRQTLSHDPRADYCGYKEGCAKELGNGPPT